MAQAGREQVMNDRYRSYEVKRLDEANVRRSLAGAVARANETGVWLMVSTREKVELPRDAEVALLMEEAGRSIAPAPLAVPKPEILP